jgi:hypothetical protein
MAVGATLEATINLIKMLGMVHEGTEAPLQLK